MYLMILVLHEVGQRYKAMVRAASGDEFQISITLLVETHKFVGRVPGVARDPGEIVDYNMSEHERRALGLEEQ
jgi:hypothetical protein